LNYAIERGNEQAANVGIQLLWTRIVWRHREPEFAIFAYPGITDQVKKFLSLSTAHLSDARPYWDEVLEAMLQIDAAFIIGLAVNALLAADHELMSAAEKVLATAAEHHALDVLKQITPVLGDRDKAWRFRIFRYGTFVKALPSESVRQWLDETGVEGARVLARSLPGPFLNDAGQPIVPEPTLTVLTRFGNDKAVFKQFCMGVHSFQMYSGDIAAEHEQEAQAAECFLNHELPVIRKWAQAEIASAKFDAEEARQEEEEFGI